MFFVFGLFRLWILHARFVHFPLLGKKCNFDFSLNNYRIYSIKRPGRLLNFWALRLGAYSRWALIRGWALIKFSPFLASEVCLFCKKTPSSGKSLIRIYSLKWVGCGWAHISVWLGGGGGGRLFEAGRLLTFSAFRMVAYSRWVLIRGWALIRINTVLKAVKACCSHLL